MHGFEAVKLGWMGDEYEVPADQQLELVARIEDVLCGGSESSATVALLRPGGPTHTKLARAYGAALRFAGADVTDDEIYLSIQTDFAAENADVSIKINMAILGLLSVVSPPVAMATIDPPKKKPKARKKAS
jgi:hypothetical protein